jgi:transposase
VSTPKRRPGRPPLCPQELARRVVALRRKGMSYRKIAAALNTAGISTPMGQQWQYQYVDRLLHTQYVRDILKQEELS